MVSIVAKAFPILRNGLAVERYARVIKLVAPDGDNQSTPFDPRYAIDVQPLTPDLADDPDWPSIANLPLPVVGVGPSAGLYAFPNVGAIVRIGFAYGLASSPYVTDVAPFGFHVPPGLAGGVVVLRDAAGGEIRLDNGQISVLAADGQAVTLNGATIQLGDDPRQKLVTQAWVDEVYTPHQHPTAAPGAPSPPTPPVNPPVSPWFTTKTEAS
jgi:hypothetical protein